MPRRDAAFSAYTASMATSPQWQVAPAPAPSMAIRSSPATNLIFTAVMPWVAGLVLAHDLTMLEVSSSCAPPDRSVPTTWVPIASMRHLPTFCAGRFTPGRLCRTCMPEASPPAAGPQFYTSLPPIPAVFERSRCRRHLGLLPVAGGAGIAQDQGK